MIDLTRGVPGVNATELVTFEEFWPYYVSQHLHPMTRFMHVVASPLGIAGAAVAAILFTPLLWIAAPLLGYGLSFSGHFVWEKNHPAAFRHPFWSLRAYLRQLWKAYSGSLGADVRAVRAAARIPPNARTLAEAE